MSLGERILIKLILPAVVQRPAPAVRGEPLSQPRAKHRQQVTFIFGGCGQLPQFCLSFALPGVVLWLLDFDISAAAGPLVLGPPVVVSGGRPVGGALDVAIVGLPVPARAAAAPPVSPVLVHLVVESVVHRYIGSSQAIDAMHMFTKLWAVPLPVFIIISDK